MNMITRLFLRMLALLACCWAAVFSSAQVDEMAVNKEGPILVLGAVPTETPFLVKQLQGIETGELYGFTYYRGKLGETDVVISLTSVGKTFTGMATALFIDRFHPRAAFMTGTAARINPEKRTGDIIVPKIVFFHDYGSLTEDDIKWSDLWHPGTRIPLARELPIDSEMHAIAVSLIESFEPHSVTVDGKTYPVTVDTDARLASADLFGVNQARIDHLRSDDVDLMEMESAAFALVCLQMDTPFLIVRSGSNQAQPTPNNDYLVYGPIAAESAARLTAFLVSQWP